ncbi:MAG: chemotaxis protein CheA [Bacillota bacterium]|nr:chemotaxis protein CheA [Bacillota bacterium]
MSDLVAGFLEEANDLLEDLSDLVLALERNPEDEGALRELFRCAHTLKGAAGLVGASQISEVTHLLEELLEKIISGDQAFTSELADILFQGFDYVKGLVAAFAAGGVGDERRHAEVLTMLSGLSKVSGVPVEAASSLPGAAHEYLLKLAPESWKKIFDSIEEGVYSVYQVVLRFDPEIFFTGQDPLLIIEDFLEVGEPLEFVRHAGELPSLEQIDPERAYMWFEIYIRKTPGKARELKEIVEFLDPDRNFVLIREISFENIVPDLDLSEGARVGVQRVAGEYINRIRSILRELQLSLSRGTAGERPLLEMASQLKETVFQAAGETYYHALSRRVVFALCVFAWALWDCVCRGVDGDAEPKLEEALGMMNLVLDAVFAGSEDDGDEAEKGAIRVLSGERKEMLGEILRQQRLYLSLNKGREDLAEPSLRRVLSSVALALGRADVAERCRLLPERDWDPLLKIVDLLEVELRGENGAGGEVFSASEIQVPGDPVPGIRGKRRFLRVEEARVERLFELAGELVIAKNSLPYLVRKLEAVWGVPEAARELKEKYQVIEQISRELQDLAMNFRLLPVSQVFQRFPRFVRDASKNLGKKVKLVIEGEETQLDKTVLEKISEPLVHLVRNSLDHGIELPEERVNLGKTPEGTLILRAGQAGPFVFIEVVDDGRGVDPGRIRKTAVEKGLIGEEEAGQLSDDEALRLIFHPGFSTRDEASDLSGRGVGMDVVKEVVDHLGGNVEVSNVPGSGFAVRLELPLTLATTRVLVVRVDDGIFGIPLEEVREVVRLRPEQVRDLGRKGMISLREKVISVVCLRELLGLPGKLHGSRSVVVLRDGVGLAVDSLDQEVEVLLKPLPGDLAGIKLYSGASLLSDGSVLLVLNPKEMI